MAETNMFLKSTQMFKELLWPPLAPSFLLSFSSPLVFVLFPTTLIQTHSHLLLKHNVTLCTALRLLPLCHIDGILEAVY